MWKRDILIKFEGLKKFSVGDFEVCNFVDKIREVKFRSDAIFIAATLEHSFIFSSKIKKKLKKKK
jgi:hypothetical protein